MIFNLYSICIQMVWVFNGIQWYSMVFYGILWYSMGILWDSMVFNGIQWCQICHSFIHFVTHFSQDSIPFILDNKEPNGTVMGDSICIQLVFNWDSIGIQWYSMVPDLSLIYPFCHSFLAR